MRLRCDYLSLTIFICIMLLAFFISCQAPMNSEDIALPPEVPVSEYVTIPVKRIIFSYYDHKKWRIVTQETEYQDGNRMKSLSSMWIFDFMPLEIIVLDSPQIHEDFIYSFNPGDFIVFRKTKIFLPFQEVAYSEEYDNLLPSLCQAGEFRALVRVVSPLKFIGISDDEADGLESQNPPRPWFSQGNVVCLKIIRY
ncbi:hypothetical protein [Silvanigrella aquatica]|uniref:Uncharacterized protein n=1 Tax=Silvanigrella aquatica TaxID=1915309 RepID=A0A1L4D0S7_9BACT|nr:hypothetical protein [Silvanigrella aquatica]APJ03788.1 hypothetical protein AXG55_07660 [Silvanigrella aquatica]